MLRTFAASKTQMLSRIVLSFFGTGLLLSASGASTLLLAGCNLCSDESLEKVISPDGHLIAETRLRDCGATTAESLLVSIRKNRNFLNDEAFVFTAKYDHSVEVTWLNNAHLKIECRDCYSKDVYRKDRKANLVTIDYDLPNIDSDRPKSEPR